MSESEHALTAHEAQAIADIPGADLAGEPLAISPWLAMSLLQKAIRRDARDWAWRAALTLFRQDPARLWRRLLVIAFEDIGVADLKSSAAALAASRGKAWRRRLGGDKRVARYLVETMCQARKCRGADDLAVCCDWDGRYESHRLQLAQASMDELAGRLVEDSDLVVRALALWLLLGTRRCPSASLPARPGDPDRAFAALAAATGQQAAVSTAAEAFRRSGAILAPFWALLLAQPGRDPEQRLDDAMPEEELIHGVPDWAYDMHTREGKRAIRTFLASKAASADWIKTHVPSRGRTEFLGGVVFRIESGLVRRRLDWPTGRALRQAADHADLTLGPDKVAVINALARADLPLINEARHAVARPHLR